MKQLGEFDYVIVGAGSAGCVIAARLSESGVYSVALLEAGGEANDFWVGVPLGWAKLYKEKKYNWGYLSEPQKALNGMRSFQSRGKLIGGTGSLNGMVYLRGQREDFQLWRQLGNVGWSYEDVLPYFKKSEGNEWGECEYHGVGGPLKITSCPSSELGAAFIKSGIQAGYPYNKDFNSPIQEGFGQAQVNMYNGRRWSTAVAFLKPARKRTNLTVITNALASRILFKDKRAVGVELKRAGLVESIKARREVIVAGGAFNSPQLLQLSGVGPVQLLKRFDIPVVVDLPGVGSNLHDHFTYNVGYLCTQKLTLNDAIYHPVRRMLMGMNYAFFRKGFLTTNGQAAQGMVRSDPRLGAPDLMFRLRLFTRSAGTTIVSKAPGSQFDIGIALLHTESRGSVRIKSADSAVHPEIRLNTFTTENDQRKAVEGFWIHRKIMSMPAMQPYVAKDLEGTSQFKTDEEVLAYCRQKGDAQLHTSSSCRMGIDDDAVVDSRLRVYGVEGVRIIDASIMPFCVGANTNATTIMIGEKGAAMVLEDATLRHSGPGPTFCSPFQNLTLR